MDAIHFQVLQQIHLPLFTHMCISHIHFHNINRELLNPPHLLLMPPQYVTWDHYMNDESATGGDTFNA